MFDIWHASCWEKVWEPWSKIQRFCEHEIQIQHGCVCACVIEKAFVEKDVTWAKASGKEGTLLRSTLGTSQLAMKVEKKQDSNGQGPKVCHHPYLHHPFEPPKSRACSAAISKGLCPFSVILSGEARSWQLPAGGQVGLNSHFFWCRFQENDTNKPPTTILP